MKKFLCVKECNGERYEYEINDIVLLKRIDNDTTHVMYDGCYGYDEDNLKTWIFEKAFIEIKDALKWEDIEVEDILRQVNEEKVCLNYENLESIALCIDSRIIDKSEDYIKFENCYLVHRDNIHHFIKVENHE